MVHWCTTKIAGAMAGGGHAVLVSCLLQFLSPDVLYCSRGVDTRCLI